MNVIRESAQLDWEGKGTETKSPLASDIAAATKGDSSDDSSDERKDKALNEQAQIIASLHQQLAAEREKVSNLLAAPVTEGYVLAGKEIERLREQLAAERESHEKELDVVEQNWRDELSDALAKVKENYDRKWRSHRAERN